jgi:hypothetical protein
VFIDEGRFLDDRLLYNSDRARTNLTARGLDAWALGARWRRAPRKSQAVDFSDDSVAGDPAELAGNLAGTQTVRPELLEPFHALIGPTHPVLPID